MPLHVRPALDEGDVSRFSAVLLEVARWLESKGEPMWRPDELTPEALTRKYPVGGMFLGWLDYEPVAAMVLLEEDSLFWPDAPAGESLFVHKLAVARRHSGRGPLARELDAAREQARGLGKAYLRLDCAADRPGLRGVYERYGFRCVGRRTVGPFDSAFYELGISGS